MLKPYREQTAPHQQPPCRCSGGSVREKERVAEKLKGILKSTD